MHCLWGCDDIPGRSSSCTEAVKAKNYHFGGILANLIQIGGLSTLLDAEFSQLPLVQISSKNIERKTFVYNLIR